jgi:hypothetical protein
LQFSALRDEGAMTAMQACEVSTEQVRDQTALTYAKPLAVIGTLSMIAAGSVHKQTFANAHAAGR